MLDRQLVALELVELLGGRQLLLQAGIEFEERMSGLEPRWAGSELNDHRIDEAWRL